MGYNNFDKILKTFQKGGSTNKKRTAEERKNVNDLDYERSLGRARNIGKAASNVVKKSTVKKKSNAISKKRR